MIRGILFAAASVVIGAAPALADPVVGRQPQTVKETFKPEITGYKVEVWQRRLDVPWSLVFLPDGSALVSERPGRIRLIAKDGMMAEAPYATMPVQARGEGGLMGLALHPKFPEQPFVYAMMTTVDGGKAVNRVVRLRHGPFAIDEQARDLWLLHMRTALNHRDLPPDLDDEMWRYLVMAAHAMVNVHDDQRPAKPNLPTT